MIGKLHITEQTVAVLNEDGVWECPHAGYEAELNALHYPRPESPDILLPFGHMALHKAAAAYRGSYELTNGAVPILDLVPPRRPITSEVVTDLREELAQQEASGEISPEDAAEAKRLLEGAASESLAASTKRFRTYLWRRKAIVQKPSGRWWDDERNVWAKNPNAEPRKAGSRKKKPKDSSSKKERDRGKFQDEFGRPPAAEMAGRIAGRGVDVQEAAEKLRATGDAYASEVADLLERQDPEAVEVKRLRQKNPDHPVAKKIRENKLVAEIAKKALEGVGEAEATAKRLASLRNDRDALQAKRTGESWASVPFDHPDWKERDRLVKEIASTKARIVGVAYRVRQQLISALGAGGVTPGKIRPITPSSDAVLRLRAGGNNVQTLSERGTQNTARDRHRFGNAAQFIAAMAPGVKAVVGVARGRTFEYDTATDTVVIGDTTPYGATDAEGRRDVAASDTDLEATFAHEIGHKIESSDPKVLRACVEFLKYRYGDERPIDVGTLPGATALDEGTYRRKDDFDRAMDPLRARYVDKTYTASHGDGLLGKAVDSVRRLLGVVDATEVLSVGLETLYRDPVSMLREDPEYAQFVIGTLLEAGQ